MNVKIIIIIIINHQPRAFTGLQTPNLYGRGEGTANVVDGKRSVATEQKQTGQRVLTTHVHLGLVLLHTHTLLCVNG